MSRPELEPLERWILAHPRQALIGGAILIFEIALLLRYALDALARSIGGAS